MSAEKLKPDEMITPANVGAVVRLLAIAKKLYSNLYVYYRRQRKHMLHHNSNYNVLAAHALSEINDSLISMIQEEIILPKELKESLEDLIFDAKSDYNLDSDVVDENVKLIVDKLEFNFNLLLNFEVEVEANLNIRDNIRNAVDTYKKQFGEFSGKL